MATQLYLYALATNLTNVPLPGRKELGRKAQKKGQLYTSHHHRPVRAWCSLTRPQASAGNLFNSGQHSAQHILLRLQQEGTQEYSHTVGCTTFLMNHGLSSVIGLPLEASISCETSLSRASDMFCTFSTTFWAEPPAASGGSASCRCRNPSAAPQLFLGGGASGPIPANSMCRNGETETIRTVEPLVFRVAATCTSAGRSSNSKSFVIW